MLGSQYGVMGMLDLIREPRAGIAPPLCTFDPIEFSSVLEPVGVSSTSRRNWVLFMISDSSIIADTRVLSCMAGYVG